MKPTQTLYYSDEHNDEFSGITREPIVIDKNYTYIHNGWLRKAASFFVYRIVMTPVAYFYTKCKFRFRIVNRQILKQAKKDGYFLFGNHTQVPGDGYIPTLIAFPKKVTVVTNADNVSLKGTRTFMEMIGAYPLPNNLSGMRNFIGGLKLLSDRGNCIAIYPEAHIWPYYTKIRPFRPDAFKYPILFSKAVYCFTVTYQKRKHHKTPRITAYVDGPFLTDTSLSQKEAQQQLRDAVYNTMQQRSNASDCEYIHYVKKEQGESE